MQLSFLAILFVFAFGATADCGWKLEGNDCICMNSADGSLWRNWTDTCCRAMGAAIGGVVRASLLQIPETAYTLPPAEHWFPFHPC